MHAAQQVSSPPLIRELATACIRYVQEAIRVELDYSAETLPILDHYLDHCRGLLLNDTQSNQRDDILTLVIPATGAYFGEVIRSIYPATHWHMAQEEYANYRLEFEPFVLTFNPLGAALEAMHRSHMDGWGAHFQLAHKDADLATRALDQLGGVRAEDFFRLTLRFEVLQQLVEALTPTGLN